MQIIYMNQSGLHDITVKLSLVADTIAVLVLSGATVYSVVK